MLYDYRKLKGRITEIFGSQKKFAQAMNWSERTLVLKLSNRVYWKQSEIERACKVLEIPIEEAVEYFFKKFVQSN